MAIRFSGAAAGYTSTAGVPTSTPFSVLCWIYLTSAPSLSTGIFWSLDSSSSQYAYLGTAGAPSTQFIFDWQGTGSTHTAGPTITVGKWYKTAVCVTGTTAYLRVAESGQNLVEYVNSTNFVFPTGTIKLWIGDSAFATYYLNTRIAGFKVYNALLGLSECEQELQSYVPQRTNALNRWYPFVKAETADYSGNGRTLSGGSGATTEVGPPIAWSRLRVPIMPWDPTTPVWYAHYDTTSGELLSLGTVAPSPVPAGTALLELLGQPDQAMYEWSTAARAFVLREGANLVDRVEDLVADASLSSVWATLDATQDQALKDRIGQLLGPHRYRLGFQNVDLD